MGHPIKTLPLVRGSEARSAEIDRPAGVSRVIQVRLNNVEPSERVIVCNLFAKEDVRATLLDELGPDRPEMALVGEALAEPRDAERLTRAAPRPDLAIVGPACGAKGVGPDADTGEEVTLVILSEVRGFDFDDAAFIHVSFCDVSGLDEIPQPLRRVRLDLVVVGAHLLAHREARVFPVARVQLGVGGALTVRADAQQRPERREGEEAPVEAEGELVEVRLEVLWRDAVMHAEQPGLEVRKDEVNQRQPFLGHVWVAVLRDRLVFEVVILEAAVPDPIVRDDVGARSDGHPGEAHKVRGLAVGNDGEAQPSRVAPTATRDGLALLTEDVLLGTRPLTLPDLYGADDERLVVDPLALAARPAAHPGLIQLDRVDASDHVDVSAHHAGAELVEDLKGRLVAVESELALELDGRHARRERGHEVGAPEPCQQRRVAVLHDGAGREPRLPLTRLAAQDVRPGGDARGLAGRLARWADEAVGPADTLHVGGAVRVVRKELLELGETLGEGKFVGHDQILPGGAKCVNRISMVWTR